MSRLGDLALGLATRRTVVVSALAIISQGVSAAALFALPVLGGRVSDLYAVGLQLPTSILAGPILGVVYLYVIGRPGYDQWSRWLAAVLVFTLALTAITMASLNDPEAIGRTIVVVFGVASAATCWGGISAVRAACQGDARAMVVVTLPPNGLLLVGLVAHLVLHTPALLPAVLYAASALMWGAALARYAREVESRHPVLTATHEADAPAPIAAEATVKAGLQRGPAQIAALCVGLWASSVVPAILIGAATALPKGEVTVLVIAVRIASSFVTVVINPYLASRYTWTSTDSGDSLRPATWFICAAAVLGVGSSVLFPSRGVISILVEVMPSWTLAVFAAPFFFRELNARRDGSLLLVRVITDLVLSSAFLLYFRSHVSISGFFAVSGISQAVTVGVCAAGLRRRLPLVAAVLVAAVCLEWLLVL